MGIVIQVLLFICPALGIESYNDTKHSETHPNSDWWFRGIVLFVSVLFTLIIFKIPFTFEKLFSAILVSISGFALVFPYLINYIHYKCKITSNANWWSHLSKTAWPDRVPIWNKIGWIGRLTVYLIIFLLTLWYYEH